MSTVQTFISRDAAIDAVRDYLSPLSGGADNYDVAGFVDALLTPNPDVSGYVFDADEDTFAVTLDKFEYTPTAFEGLAAV